MMWVPTLFVLLVLVCRNGMTQCQGGCCNITAEDGKVCEECCNNGSTPASFEADFNQSCINQSLNGQNCSEAWTTFMGAFASMDPQNVTCSDYVPYINLFSIDSTPDQTLFWSRTKASANMLSMMEKMQVDVITTANQKASAIIIGISRENGCDRLHWCGDGTGGLNSMSPCSGSVSLAFWHEYSKQLAMSAQGTVFFLGNGTNRTAINEISTFLTCELPNLQVGRVSRVVAIVIFSREGDYDSCKSNRSLADLEDKVLSRNMTFVCYDIVHAMNSAEQSLDNISKCATYIIKKIQTSTSSDAEDTQNVCDAENPEDFLDSNPTSTTTDEASTTTDEASSTADEASSTADEARYAAYIVPPVVVIVLVVVILTIFFGILLYRKKDNDKKSTIELEQKK